MESKAGYFFVAQIRESFKIQGIDPNWCGNSTGAKMYSDFFSCPLPAGKFLG